MLYVRSFPLSSQGVSMGKAYRGSRVVQEESVIFKLKLLLCAEP